MSCEYTPDQQALAQKILMYSRRYITRGCPLLLAPVYALKEEVSPEPGPLATDGIRLWYDPQQVIQDFQDDRNALARQLLHITVHCLMGHLSVRYIQEDTEVFDQAADWKTTELIEALGIGLIQRECQLEWRRYCRHYWPNSLENTSLAQLVRRCQEDPETREQLDKAAQIPYVRLDDHQRWAVLRSPDPRSGTGAGQEGPDWKGMLQEITAQARQDSTWGHLGGVLEAELTPEKENGITYTQFLKRFAAPSERMLLDPDSFDPRWYWLGLEQYGDMPLLEPSEISEPPLPDDIVIALDTSSSCCGDVCRRFLRETLSLLRDISAGISRFRVLLLQCDTEIQKELLVEDAGQLDQLLEDFSPKGFGGTDFCPVFERVAQRQTEGVLPRVRGLLYLSDGYGDFPETAPDYPVVFLMLEDEDWGAPRLPAWVTGLYLNQNDFTVKEASL